MVSRRPQNHSRPRIRTRTPITEKAKTPLDRPGIPYINARLGIAPKGENGPEKQKRALAFMKQRREIARISVATYAEVIRNYEDKPEAEKAEALVDELNPPLQLTQQHARRWARMQNRSNRVMGDNDAWNAALAISANAKLIGSDKAFDNRPDLDYYDYMK